MSKKRRRGQGKRTKGTTGNAKRTTETTVKKELGESLRGSLDDGSPETDMPSSDASVDRPVDGDEADAETEDTDATGGDRGLPRWVSSLLGHILKAYEIATSVLGIGLMVSMIVAVNKGGPILQWVLGITAMLATFLSQTVFAGDIGDIYSEAKAQVEEDRRRDEEELANGNYDGVPRTIREMFKYPTQEDYDMLQEEAKRQQELLRDFRKPRKGDGDDEPSE